MDIQSSEIFIFAIQVTLKVQPGSGLGTEDVQIVCSDQELQDFVSRLKDAKNNLEKIANKWLFYFVLL